MGGIKPMPLALQTTLSWVNFQQITLDDITQINQTGSHIVTSQIEQVHGDANMTEKHTVQSEVKPYIYITPSLWMLSVNKRDCPPDSISVASSSF